MSGELTDGDSIESEICDDGEYGEIVVYLRVESISLDIEVSSEDFYHPDGDDGSQDFASYLGEGVGVDLSSGHRFFLEYIENMNEWKMSCFSLGKYILEKIFHMPKFTDISHILTLSQSHSRGDFAVAMERELGYTWDGTLEGKVALMDAYFDKMNNEQ